MIPGHPSEAGVSLLTDHRIGQPSQLSKLSGARPRETTCVCQSTHIETGHRIEAHQIESHHAQMHAVHREVSNSRRPERAAVTHAPRQNPPGKWQLAPV